MAETIFLLNNDGELVEMTEAHYLTEDALQKLFVGGAARQLPVPQDLHFEFHAFVL